MSTPSIWTNAFLDKKRSIADPVADDLIAQMVLEKGAGEAKALFDLLIRNIEMPLDRFPAAIQQFVQEWNSLPDWIDFDQVNQAHTLFLDHGPKFLIFLYYKSLPLLYSCKNGAEVLVRTSRLTNEEENLEIFARRIAETGQFLLDVMARNALVSGGGGIQSTLKVRLIHAAIRYFIQLGTWDEATLGKPINQEDMALTLMSFSVSILDGLPQFGIQEDEGKLEAFLHTWTGIGTVLGIQKDLLPQNLEQARLLLDTILKRQSRASEAGQLLTKALIDFGEKTVPREALDGIPSSLLRYMVGPEKAALLGLAPNAGCLGLVFPKILQSVFKVGERVEEKLPKPLDLVLDQLSKATIKGMVNYFNNFKGQHFHIPEEFETAWM